MNVTRLFLGALKQDNFTTQHHPHCPCPCNVTCTSILLSFQPRSCYLFFVYTGVTWPWMPCNATSLAKNPTCGVVPSPPHVVFFAKLVALQGFHGHGANRTGFPCVTEHISLPSLVYAGSAIHVTWTSHSP